MTLTAHRFRYGALSLSLGALVAGCATFPLASDEGGPPWMQVDSAHFSLVTDMKDGPARELAGTLEDWWSAMSVALGMAGAAPAPSDEKQEPLLVIALRSRAERQGVHYDLGGMFVAFPLVPPAISIGNIDEEGGLETLKHELAHALLYQRLPRVPRWFTEGMAVYLQNAELDRARAVARWGFLNQSEIHDWMTFGRSVSTREMLEESDWAGFGLGALEVRAGLLVHMLTNRHPDQLACYLRRLETALDPDTALQCFGNREGWDSELNDYAYGLSFASRSAPVEVRDLVATTSPIHDAAVHAVLAMLDLMVLPTESAQFRPDREERARRNLARALTLDPGQLLGGLLTATRIESDSRSGPAISLAPRHSRRSRRPRGWHRTSRRSSASRRSGRCANTDGPTHDG
jgi:hypothetical protein